MGSSPAVRFGIVKLAAVISVLLVFCCTVFFLIQTSIREFEKQEARRHMTWMANSVIYFCNVSYDGIARIGRLDDVSQVRLQQAEVLEQVEDFIRNNDFKIVVQEVSTKPAYLLLNSFSQGTDLPPNLKKQPFHEIGAAVIDGVEYNTLVIPFDSWNWKISLFKDISAYDELMSKLNIIYISFGILIILLCFAIVLFFKQLVKTGTVFRQSQQELKSILDSLTEGVITLNEKGRITQMNPASLSMCRISKNKTPIGRHVADILALTCGRGSISFDRKDFEKGGSEHLLEHGSENLNLRLPDGIERVVQMRFSRRRSENRSGPEPGFSLVISLHDVTETLQLQERMMQSEKMLSVGGLAAGMAHEINNPLGGMIQNAQVIKNRLVDSFPANDAAAAQAGTTMDAINDYMKERKIIRLLDNMITAGSHAAKIVNNMLSFAKKGNSAKEEFDMAQLLEKTLEIARSDYDLKKKYDFKEIDVVKRFDPNCPPIPCEAGKIMQVFFNIIRNASQAMADAGPERGKPQLILSLKSVEGKVQIGIQDNGPGMAENVKKRIFEPFFTTKEVDQGTGLGLSLSYFVVVEDHGGEMEVESSAGKGTRFIIRLPLS